MGNPVKQGFPFSTPPPIGEPMESPIWEEWFQSLFDSLLRDGAVVPSISIGNAQGKKQLYADTYIEQELISIDGGLYSNYSTDNGQIAYGFAANVRRFGGNAFTVGAQLNAWGGRGVTQGVWGVAVEAIAELGCTAGLSGTEQSVVSQDSTNINIKIGSGSVFKDRLDGAATTSGGLGSDRHNYYSLAFDLSSQERSASLERCGWTRGMFFRYACLDEQLALAWNNTTAYTSGMVVTSGGQAWQAIQTNTNQLPAAGIYWVLHNVGLTAARAIGIDFSSLDVTTMGRISSAIRLRDSMRFHWESTGSVGTYFDAALARLVLVENGGIPWMAVDVTNGFIYRNGVFLI